MDKYPTVNLADDYLKLSTDENILDMNADYSTAPGIFQFALDKNFDELVVKSVLVVIDGPERTNSLHFPGLSAALTNGLVFGYQRESGSSFESKLIVKHSADMHLWDNALQVINYPGASETICFNIIESAGASFSTRAVNNIFLEISDDLSTLHFMRAFLKGYYV